MTDPAQLPAMGAAGCLHAATRAHTGPESTALCTPERTTFLRRLFCVLARYEAFSGNSGVIQRGLIARRVRVACQKSALLPPLTATSPVSALPSPTCTPPLNPGGPSFNEN